MDRRRGPPSGTRRPGGHASIERVRYHGAVIRPPSEADSLIVQVTYGSPDVLELRDIDPPVVNDDDVLVRVRAAAVNPPDFAGVTWVPYIARLATGLRSPRGANADAHHLRAGRRRPPFQGSPPCRPCATATRPSPGIGC